MNLAVHVQGKVLSHVVVVGGVEESLPQLPGHRVTGPRKKSEWLYFLQVFYNENKQIFAIYFYTRKRNQLVSKY